MSDWKVEGMTFEEHRAAYPDRWRKRTRAWRFFWISLLIVPIVAALNWLSGESWSRLDIGMCVGWIMSRFWVAFDPDTVNPRTTWLLDQPSAWQRVLGRGR